jgi:alkylation response protein AidB-like acyl-CoA dehydrogenase
VSIDLSLSDDQQAVDDLFAGFLGDQAPPSLARSAEPLGFDRSLWEALGQLGAPGMGAPAEAGGGGAGLAELVVAAERLGRSIAPVPLVEHLVASRVHPDPDVVVGDAVAAVALRPAGSDGSWSLVPGGAVADVVVGVDGDDLVAVESTPPMAAPRNHACAPLADRSAREGRRLVVGEAAAMARVLDEWRVLTAAALVGIAAQALDLGVAYVTERHQFGRPIGSFQAVQHGLADLPGSIDGARLLAHQAAWTADGGGTGALDVDRNDIAEPAVLAAMAFLFSADVAALATDRSLHFHGGYGFAEEYDIQLYHRRARGWALVLGDPAREARRLADLLFGLADPVRSTEGVA